VLGYERSELERLSSYPNVLGVHLNEPGMHDYLMDARISTANAVLALSPDDHANLLVAQIAHKIYNVPIVVCHVENPQLQVIFSVLDTSNTLSVISYSVGVLQDIRFAMESSV